MTAWQPDDEMARALGALRVHDASPERTERIRARCVSELRARREAEESRQRGGARWRTWLEPAVALGLGFLYLAEAVARALAVYR